MKTIGITSAALLAALLGVAASAYAGQERQSDKQDHSKLKQDSHQQARPQQQHAQKQQQPRHEQNRPQQHSQQQHPQQQEQRRQTGRTQEQKRYDQQSRHDQNRPQQHSQQMDRVQQQDQYDQRQHPQQERGNRGFQRSPEQRRSEQRVWQEHRASNWQSDHRTWQQRGGYNGYRIPDGRFRGDFGRSHWFRIGGLPFMVEGGYPRFQYRGYWFNLLDPWPAYWGDNWYDNDEVYVDYVNNGYYLFNRRYPGMGIAISISM